MSQLLYAFKALLAISMATVFLASSTPMQVNGHQSQITLRPTLCAGTVSITFDDGPHSQLTPKALDALLLYDVQATFFVVGHEIDGNESIIKRMVAEGHSVQNHTHTHPFLTDLDNSQVSIEIQKANQAIMQAGAPAPIYFRAPYDNYNQQTLRVIEEEGLYNISWTYALDVRDWDGLTPEEIKSGVLNNLVTGGVILFHDTQPNTIEALPDIIEGIHREGYCINSYRGEDFWILDTHL